MFRKGASILVSIAGALLALAFALQSIAIPAQAQAGVGPAGTPIGDQPTPPYRLYLPLIIRTLPSGAQSADLVVTAVFSNMRGFTGGCVTRYDTLMVKVCARNQGGGDAGEYAITVDGKEGARSAGLRAGASECLETVPSVYGYQPVTVALDSANEVAESNEANNVWTGYVPIPTPPVLCTATPAR